MEVPVRLDARERVPVRLRARTHPGAGARDPPDPRDACEPAPVSAGVVEAGRREARGRPARGPELDRLRAQGRDRLPHLHRDGARPVRRALPLVPTPPHAEDPDGRLQRPPQGRVPRRGSVTMTAVLRSGLAERRLTAVVLTAAAAAWVVTADRMAGMDAGPGTELGSVGWFGASWFVMMAAMMLPAAAPMVVAYGRRAVRADMTGAFAGAYLLTWLAAGLVGYAGIEAVRSLNPGLLGWGSGGRYAAGGVIAFAGLYQLTAAKRGCLRRCRDRRSFMHEHWRAGRVGALRMGIAHGAYCIGCSWALMATLFALGVMILTWMAITAALIAAERLLDRRARLVVGVALVALAACVAVAPGDVPALTVPGSQPMHAMQKD